MTPEAIDRELRELIKLQSSAPKEMLEGALQLLEAAEQTDSQPTIARACQVIGGGYRRQHQFDLAERYLGRALAAAQDLPELQAKIHTQFGAMYNDQREFPLAKKHLRQTLKIHTHTNDVHGLAVAHFNLGNHFRLQGRSEQAREHYSKSLKFYAQAGDENGVAINLGSLGYLARDRGDMDDAEFRFSTAQEILRRRKDHHNEAKLCIERAFVQVAGGHETFACTLIEQGESIAREHRIPNVLFNASLLRSMLMYRTGDAKLHDQLTHTDALAEEFSIPFSLDELRLLATTALGDDAEGFVAKVIERRD